MCCSLQEVVHHDVNASCVRYSFDQKKSKKKGWMKKGIRALLTRRTKVHALHVNITKTIIINKYKLQLCVQQCCCVRWSWWEILEHVFEVVEAAEDKEHANTVGDDCFLFFFCRKQRRAKGVKRSEEKGEIEKPGKRGRRRGREERQREHNNYLWLYVFKRWGEQLSKA